MKKGKIVHGFIIGTFVSLYLAVSVISTLHVIRFFELSNPYWLSVSLAIAFELGAAASLASLIVLDKMNKFLVWALFIILTLFQSMGNVYYAYVNLHDFSGWVELFDLVDEDLIYQKRILSMISGGILPFVALGFIKSLVDYIRPNEDSTETEESIEKDKLESDVTVEQPNTDPLPEIEYNDPQINTNTDTDTDSDTESEEIDRFVKEEIYPVQEVIETAEIMEIQEDGQIEVESQIESIDKSELEKMESEEFTKEEISSIIGGSEEFIDEDEEKVIEEISINPNIPIPIQQKDPNQSY